MTPYFSQPDIDIYHGSAESLPLADATVQTCVTSPPYWGLRDYGIDGQIGLEPTPEEYVSRLVTVFREVRRVLRDDGTLWLNLGDSYAGGKCGRGDIGNIINGVQTRTVSVGVPSQRDVPEGFKPKDLVGIPWSVAFALRADGWYLRSDIIWSKPNPMPESVTDRPTKAHEYIFLLSKSDRYFYDADAIAEPSVDPESLNGRNPRNDDKFASHDPDGFARTRGGFAKIEPGKLYLTRNRRSVWTVPSRAYEGAHFATFPPDLIEPCIKAGSRPGDLVLDPFNGSGTTGEVCRKWGRRYVGVELNAAYIDLSAERFRQQILWPAGTEVA